MLVYPDPVTWEYIDQCPDKEARERVFKLCKKLSEMDFLDSGAQKEEWEATPYFRFNGEAQELFIEWCTALERVKLRNTDEEPVIIEHLGKYRSLMPSLVCSTHSLRRTQAVDLWQKTRNPKLIQELLGQASIAATTFYLELTKDEALNTARQHRLLN